MHDEITDINIVNVNSQMLVTFSISSILLQASPISAQESILGPCLWDESITDLFEKVLGFSSACLCVQMFVCVYRFIYTNGKVYRKLKVQLHTKEEAVNPIMFIL